MGNMCFNKEFIKEMQIIENGVFRKILGARDHTPNTALRGDLGASLMESRFMQTKLLFVKSIMDGENELLKEILYNIRGDNKNLWNKKLNDYLSVLRIRFNRLKIMSNQEIIKVTRNFDTENWVKEIEKKTSIRIYRKFKKEIKEEQIYRNDFASILLFQARSNTLSLNIENRFRNESTICELCKVEGENLEHFVLKCRNLDGSREKNFIEKFKDMNNEDILGNMLFDYENIETTKKMLVNLWRDREIQLKSKQK